MAEDPTLDRQAMALLVERYLGRPAIDAELDAMRGEMLRDTGGIALHPLGQNGGLFRIEPSGFDAWIKKEAGR